MTPAPRPLTEADTGAPAALRAGSPAMATARTPALPQVRTQQHKCDYYYFIIFLAARAAQSVVI